MKCDNCGKAFNQSSWCDECSGVESLKRDKARLDWCERHLLFLADGGGAYTIKFGPVHNTKVLGDIEELGTVRSAIDAAVKEGK